LLLYITDEQTGNKHKATALFNEANQSSEQAILSNNKTLVRRENRVEFTRERKKIRRKLHHCRRLAAQNIFWRSPQFLCADATQTAQQKDNHTYF